jgi:hypothetical protein
MSTRRKYRRLKRLVERWIRAEWAFRYGPDAYQNYPTKKYLQAERRVRRAVTGTKELGKAGLRLGCKEKKFKPLKLRQAKLFD